MMRRTVPVVGRTVSAVVDNMVDMVHRVPPTIPAVGAAPAQADAPSVVTPIPARAPPTIVIPAVVVTPIDILNGVNWQYLGKAVASRNNSVADRGRG